MSKTIQVMEKGTHSPTLNTILMVEDVLKDAEEMITVAELKRRLPRKVMHQTLLQILDYLQESRKILIGTKGILWVDYVSPKLTKAIKNSTDYEDLPKIL